MRFTGLIITALLAALVAAPAQGKDKEDKDPAAPKVVAQASPPATPTPTPSPAVTATPFPVAPVPPAKGKDKKGKVDDAAPPAATPPAAPPAAAPAPAPSHALPPAARPVAGRTVGADVAHGTVQVQLPGSDTYVPLADAASMPVGTVIDARAGAVVLHATVKGHGTDTGTFSGGRFDVRQRDGYTELRLRGGDYGHCPRPGAATAAAVSGRNPVVRRLWGSDHRGRFRTYGHNSVATVRGTRWLTEDRCDGTRTSVTEGAVSVHVRHSTRTVLVRAGHSFLAPRER